MTDICHNDILHQYFELNTMENSQPFIRSFILSLMIGDKVLPPTCKINYVNMQDNNVNMRLIYVNIHMQHNYGDIIKLCVKINLHIDINCNLYCMKGIKL